MKGRVGAKLTYSQVVNLLIADGRALSSQQQRKSSWNGKPRNSLPHTSLHRNWEPTSGKFCPGSSCGEPSIQTPTATRQMLLFQLHYHQEGIVPCNLHLGWGLCRPCLGLSLFYLITGCKLLIYACPKPKCKHPIIGSLEPC